MALDPFVAQLWWNVNSASRPDDWSAIEAYRLLAERLNVPYEPNDPRFKQSIQNAVLAAGGQPVVIGAGDDLPPSYSTAPPPGHPGGPATTTPAPASTTSTSSSSTSASRSIFFTVASIMNEAGLGSLYSVDSSGNPSGWLWDRIVGGIDSMPALLLEMEQTDAFKNRYPAIAVARESGGLVPTPKDVREYEDRVSEMMRRSGVPTWMFDTKQELQAYMIRGLSAAEIEDKLGESWRMVNEAPAEVRAAFGQFFGPSGAAGDPAADGALAAFFLDPETTRAKLDKYARTAYTAGMGKTLGLDIDKTLATRIAELPETEGGIWDDLMEVNRMRGFFEEGATETDDLDESTGIDAQFFGDSGAELALDRRLRQRQANSITSTGGAVITGAGVVGVG